MLGPVICICLVATPRARLDPFQTRHIMFSCVAHLGSLVETGHTRLRGLTRSKRRSLAPLASLARARLGKTLLRFTRSRLSLLSSSLVASSAALASLLFLLPCSWTCRRPLSRPLVTTPCPRTSSRGSHLSLSSSSSTASLLATSPPYIKGC